MNILYPEFLILLFGIAFFYFKNPKFKLLYLSLGLMIVALTRPVMTEAVHEEKVEGIEAVVAIDLSYSMRADDIKPSRLAAAKEAIKSLFKMKIENRYALYGFTTNALILSPPTRDYALLIAALDSIKEENILTHGTSLKALLESMAKRDFPIQNVIIFSDGGEEKDIDKLLLITKKADIKIIAVGMATKGGALLHDNYGKVLKDPTGALVVTKLNPILKPLSLKSGGAYITFEDPVSTASDIASVLDTIAQKSIFSQRDQSYRELFWIPLLFALLFFFFHFITLPKKWLALIPFITLSSEASLFDWVHIDKAKNAYAIGSYEKTVRELEKISHKSLQSEFDRAIALYRLQKYKSALHVLQGLQTNNRRLKFKILFLKGNSYAKMGQYIKARHAYQQALVLQEDPNVLYNLKAILGKKPKKQPKPPVYQKKESQKEGFFAKDKKPQSSKQKAEKGKGKRKKVSRPLGYKAYELINKGYIDEKKPW